jgi:FlaA1/EpsC-like NDP-sugar epimerase
MNNKRILIIGGTGALGKNLINLYQNNNQIRVFSRDEHKQVSLAPIVSKNVTFMIGNVRDEYSLTNAIEDFLPHIIINTAALKHVPICEVNPFESVQVNIVGHQNLLNSIKRSRHKIETVIFVSTDKACKPINVYGMCKSISERLYIEYAKKQSEIKVCIVRYGNILESTGSVIPFFKQLLEKGNTELPITDSRMTRFLITLDQAVKLIEWSYNCPTSHGKICVPKVQSFSIVDIAKTLLKVYRGSEFENNLKFVGIRKGEKLHEEMISAEEWMRTEDDENYMITDDILTNEAKSYNSLDVVMPSDKVYEYLVNNGVIKLIT